MEAPKKSGEWKWIAGGLALFLAWSTGYEAGQTEGRRDVAAAATSTNLSLTPAATATYDYDALDSALDAQVAAKAPDAPEKRVAGDAGPEGPADDEDSLAMAAGTGDGAPETYAAASAPPAVVPLSIDNPAEITQPVAAVTAPAALHPGQALTTRRYASPATAAPVYTSAAKPTSSYAAPTYTPPSTSLPRIGCAENGSCYGDISAATGRARTTHVSGYYRRDGTYVRSHYRSRGRR